MTRTGSAAAAVILGVVLAGAPAGAQTLREFGAAGGWRIQAIDNDACIMTRGLGTAQDIELMFRLEPGQDTEFYITGLMPQAVPDPGQVDWGRLTPVQVEYDLADDQVRSTEGDIGYEYVDATQVRGVLSFAFDGAEMGRIAAAEIIRLAVNGESFGAFPMAGAGEATAVARRCMRQLG